MHGFRSSHPRLAHENQERKAMSSQGIGVACLLGMGVALGCGAGPSSAEAVDTRADGHLGTGFQRLDYEGHTYFFSTESRPWADALGACHAMGLGLVTVNDSAENAWLRAQQPTVTWWLGGNDRTTEGAWSWASGASTYTNWATGEPNNANNEDCATTTPSGWNDVPCTTSYRFICESFNPPQQQQYNGHDYIFFEQPKSWVDAQFTCAQQGYSLVTVNDGAEDAWLKQQAPSRSMWLGYNDRSVEGRWVWEDGAPTYTNWRPGEPNNTGGNEDCAVNNSVATTAGTGGRWNDIPCTDVVSFVCESREAGPVLYQYVNFTASNTLSATQGTTDVTLSLEPGDVLSVGTCGVPGAFATNDTYLRLLGPTGEELFENDDACKGSGSQLRYKVPACGGGTYVIKVGCYESGSCGGRLGYTY
jgi:hypothetical protein